MPGRNEACVFSLLAITVALIVCVWSLLLGFHGEAFLGRPLGGDFVQFYVSGKILNHYDAWRIYDLKLAVDLQHAVLPAMASTQMLVFAQAPYIAALFRPFALLPYAWAYVAWLIVSAVLYAASLALFFHSARLDHSDKKTGYLLALSAMPFLFETWIGGQVSVVAFFCWSLFFFYLSKNLRFVAGAALGLLLFKPTLVALPVAMLLCGRRWRILAGFATGSLAMTLASIGIAGWHGVRAWVQTLLFDSQFTKRAVPVSHLAKNVDLNAFLALLLPSTVANVFFIVLSAAGFLWLALAWWRSKHDSDQSLWAATLCFTLILSPYAPIYDSILVVGAVALLAGTPRTGMHGAPDAWLVVLYMLPWITQSFAQYLHLQLFTLAIAGFAAWTLRQFAPVNNNIFNKITEEWRRILELGPLKTAQEDRTMPNQTGHRSTGRF